MYVVMPARVHGGGTRVSTQSVCRYMCFLPAVYLNSPSLPLPLLLYV
jgi:hypothetical protein